MRSSGKTALIVHFHYLPMPRPPLPLLESPVRNLQPICNGARVAMRHHSHAHVSAAVHPAAVVYPPRAVVSCHLSDIRARHAKRFHQPSSIARASASRPFSVHFFDGVDPTGNDGLTVLIAFRRTVMVLHQAGIADNGKSGKDPDTIDGLLE